MELLEDWLEEWSDKLSDGSVTAESRTVYLRSVRQFLAYLATDHPGADDPAKITTKMVSGWLRRMTEAGRAPATRRIRLKSLRLWFGYMSKDPDSGVTVNPAEGADLPVAPEKPVPVLSDDTLATLLKVMDGAGFVDRRDTAIVRVLLDTGCRRGELAGVTTDDVDLAQSVILLRKAKGGKARYVPLSSRTVIALRKYLRVRAKETGAGRPELLLSTRGEGLTGKGVAEMLERRCREAGIPKINPHAFRHTWAHDLLAAGAGETDVERLAGWSTPLMVRRYGSSAADQRARDAARKLSRGDRV